MRGKGEPKTWTRWVQKQNLGRVGVVGQITAIFERNRANDDTSIKFGTFVLQGILIKSA